MEKYDPSQIEQKWYQSWENQGYFAPSGEGPAFSIAIPPPNVTGTLHMGHAFQHSLVDAIIRRQRMLGRNTLWQMGTDHAGISTQLIVAEQMAAEGLKPSDIGRDAFIERVWEWKESSGGIISRQLRRMGASLHWDTERFTLDEGLSRAVVTVFERLFDEGLIYRGKRLVNWDPVLQTSISDLEVISEEEQGHLWHLRYPLADDPNQHLIVATTRPETMLGDTAVAVHPDDERYAALIGRHIALPLTDRTIPIIADRYVDMEFGTGCVKITPAHDFNDYDMGNRHDLPMINVMNPNGTMNEAAGNNFEGLDRFEARAKIVDALEECSLLEKIEPHTLMVPRGEKSHAIIEPLLSDQWFVQIDPLAKPAIQAVEDGSIEFIPKQAENIYFAWMRELKDWCISRQQWWGHRIPAFYDAEGNIFVAQSEAAARAKYNIDDDAVLTQDEDVLDTWFSSALWTFSTLGWPDKTASLATFHPTKVMVTGHDIISFWVSRMIMMTLKFMDEVPFNQVYVHGLVTDAEGQKMSKSKGNGLDPMDIIDGISAEALVEKRTSNLLQTRMQSKIEKATRKEFPEGIPAYGTDALRFTFYSLASGARGLRFDMKRVEGYRNFCNKLWNAANFTHLSTQSLTEHPTAPSNNTIDRWINQAFENAAMAVNRAMEDYRFDLAAKALYDFIWNEFCDWYLELSKPILQTDQFSQAEKTATQSNLLQLFERILRLAHPFMPFITEELWQSLPAHARTGDSIMLAAFPQGQDSEDRAILDEVAWLKEIVSAIRNIRGEQNIPPGKPIPIIFHLGSDNDRSRYQQFLPMLDALLKPSSIGWHERTESPPPSAVQVIDDLQILVPLAGLIDKAQELERLDKELTKVAQEITRIQTKLGNEQFVANAPTQVVDKEREKLSVQQHRETELTAQRRRIEAL